ncbi:non-reducing polyketide synthase spyA [Aspergillus stella-maris]|uniref:non-reducing polyketide synthase spyA n=1 Tax=Aspergillus stella-maris TaxID=1810926 RepID=UPI003CCCAE72
MTGPLPSLVLCGSQTSPPSPDDLRNIGAQLGSEAYLQGIAEAVRALPKLWVHLVQANPLLSSPSGDLVGCLARWIDEDDYELIIPPSLPNTLLAPLTVIIHFVQYFEYLESTRGLYDVDGDSHSQILLSAKQGGFQGLCTGLLSATALACAADKSQLAHNASVAIRLAMCIGAYVDLDKISYTDGGGTGCLIVHQSPNPAKADIEQALVSHPNAYISVQLDDRVFTVTAPIAEIPALRQSLVGHGLKATTIPINGRYHTRKNVQALSDLLGHCAADPSLSFPTTATLQVPVRSNTTGRLLSTGGPLHEECLRCIMTERANWVAVVNETATLLASCHSKTRTLLELGIPRSLARGIPDLQPIPRTEIRETINYPNHAVAVIGAAGRFAGAESLDQLWHLLKSGQSMAGHPPPGRDGLPADGPLGNYMANAAGFDHEFFGVSPREAQYMDPQQRIALQVAYQAVESSGYLSHKMRSVDVGCYVGVAGSDYDHNIASHKPTAFSYTGTSRAFVAGRVSHHFGWEGPSLTIDTACSSSAVAIHQACKDLGIGECEMALAGGVNVICSPIIHDNLQAARFLDPSGPCKSFQAGGKGYCRGEGCGFVLLKKLSSALADGDDILGVIAGSGTTQCDAGDTITVPSCAAQMKLQHRVLSAAGLDPAAVSYVEAHGTGTPKGDPIECESIRQVFKRSSSDPKLRLGTLKANIGHTEAASGIAALLKVLLMLKHAQVPPQPGFTSINPAIAPLEPDNMEIPAALQPWHVKRRIACVNNYGASGNNAALIVCDSPDRYHQSLAKPAIVDLQKDQKRHPVLLAARSTSSLRKYCSALERMLAHDTPRPVAAVAFHIAQQQNRAFRHRAMFTFSNLSELKNQLVHFASDTISKPLLSIAAVPKPVVLVFAGQSSNIVHLNREVYDSSKLLQYHLLQCDQHLREMGRSSLFPHIFMAEPLTDVVLLHSIIFSIQYACAAAWLDCGLPVQRIIGHSIGQLTAMCVAGVVDLEDGLKLVVGRALLVREKWGAQRGCMLAVEIDRDGAETLIASVLDHKVEIACFNGPSRHVLVGTEAAIQAVEATTTCKAQRLKTTNGYHSALMDCLIEEYTELARTIKYSAPNIPIETCSEAISWSFFTPELVAQHSRGPVFFWQAVSRIVRDLGQCTWVEAGSSSSGVSLARSALDPKIHKGHSFVGSHLAGPDALGSLVDTTCQLWSEGVDVLFWLHHQSERPRHQPLSLPGYQFDETAHWVPYKDRNVLTADSQGQAESPLLSLVSSVDRDADSFEFAVNQSHSHYEELIQGRLVLGERLAPVSLYMELATHAIRFISRPMDPTGHGLQFDSIQLHAALGCGTTHDLNLLLQRDAQDSWGLTVTSRTGSEVTVHATALFCTSPGPENITPQVAYAALEETLSSADTAVAQGHLVYKLLDRVVDYQLNYRGIKSLVMNESQAAALVELPSISRRAAGQKSCHHALMDQFILAAEMQALALPSCGPSEVFICHGIGGVRTYTDLAATNGPWKALVQYTQKRDAELICDTYVFDAATGALAVTVTNAKYIKLPISSLRTILDRAKGIENPSIEDTNPSGEEVPQADEVEDTISQLIYESTGIRAETLATNSSLSQGGVDSLGVTELESRIREVFNVDIRIQYGVEEHTFESLCSRVRASISDDVKSTRQLTPRSDSSPVAWEKHFSSLVQILAEFMSSSESLLPQTEVQSLGLDSLSLMELESTLFDRFGVKLDLMQQPESATLGDLSRSLAVCNGDNVPTESEPTFFNLDAVDAGIREVVVPVKGDRMQFFGEIRQEIGACAEMAGFAAYYQHIHSRHTDLVLSYILEAFSLLGCDLQRLSTGDLVIPVPHIPRHDKVVLHYYTILEQTGFIKPSDSGRVRTSKPAKIEKSLVLHQAMIRDFPKYRSELDLLNCTGSRLADCLAGRAEPLHLLFGSPSSTKLMQEVYKNTPMFKMGTLMLGKFLSQGLSRHSTVKILEIGAGTGGTTEYILQQLTASGVDFRYTFTDISSALVAQARRRFSAYHQLDYSTLDIEKLPATVEADYDIIISSNCIHATKNLSISSRNCARLLKPGGLLCLLELTRDLWWLDCVFGLLEGWWLFEDERQHVLASEELWKRILLGAGFDQVDWSDDGSKESSVFRVIVAKKSGSSCSSCV